MIKVLMCVNTLTSLDQRVYSSHCAMWYRIGRQFSANHAKFINYTPQRVSIDNARNFAAKLAMETECTHLMFIDDDMILHEETFRSLLAADKDVVMALTCIRSFPFNPMQFICKEEGEILSLYPDVDFEERVDPETGLVEVDAIGCACVLIKVDLIKKLEPPFFVTTPTMTEDVYFCLKAKNYLGRKNVGIFVDTKVPTGHLSDKEVISYPDRKNLIKYHTTVNGLEIEKLKAIDRGEIYAKMVDPDFEECLP